MELPYKGIEIPDECYHLLYRFIKKLNKIGFEQGEILEGGEDLGEYRV